MCRQKFLECALKITQRAQQRQKHHDEGSIDSTGSICVGMQRQLRKSTDCFVCVVTVDLTRDSLCPLVPHSKDTPVRRHPQFAVNNAYFPRYVITAHNQRPRCETEVAFKASSRYMEHKESVQIHTAVHAGCAAVRHCQHTVQYWRSTFTHHH